MDRSIQSYREPKRALTTRGLRIARDVLWRDAQLVSRADGILGDRASAWRGVRQCRRELRHVSAGLSRRARGRCHRARRSRKWFLVLEVGCGTGKLTELLTARQLNVDAVDPGPRMIEQAKRRVGDRDDVRFHIGRFEDVPLPEKAFDAVFSATAFHWVEPLIGWAKAASHLRSGGLLALLAHMTVHDVRSAAADEGFRELLRKHAPTLAEGHLPARDLDAILAGARQRAGNVSDVWDWVMGAGRRQLTSIDAADLFEDVDVTSHVAVIAETGERVSRALSNDLALLRDRRGQPTGVGRRHSATDRGTRRRRYLRVGHDTSNRATHCRPAARDRSVRDPAAVSIAGSRWQARSTAPLAPSWQSRPPALCSHPAIYPEQTRDPVAQEGQEPFAFVSGSARATGDEPSSLLVSHDSISTRRPQRVPD